MRACPVCHTVLREQANFCDHCGHPLSPVVSEPGGASPWVPPALAEEVAPGTCSACGFRNVPGEMFCQNCGVQLAPVASAPPPPPVQVQFPLQPGFLARPPDRCPVCGYRIDPEDAFCQNCGAEAPYSAAPTHGLPPEPVEPATLAEQQKLAARLVVSASKEEILLDLSRDEWVVGRTDPQRGIYPDIDLSPYGGDKSGVSRRHARLVTQGGRRWISDLNSTNFTFLNGEKLEPGGYYPLTSGDQVRLGLLTLRYIEENAE
jgi:hypothetical protein